MATGHALKSYGKRGRRAKLCWQPVLRVHDVDPGPPDVRAQADWLMWVRHVAYRVASDKAAEDELQDPPWLALCEPSTQGWWRWTKALYYTGIDEIDQHKLTELDVEAQELAKEADSLTVMASVP